MTRQYICTDCESCEGIGTGCVLTVPKDSSRPDICPYAVGVFEYNGGRGWRPVPTESVKIKKPTKKVKK